HVVKMKYPPIAPEIFGVGKEVPLVSRHGNRNGAPNRFVISLALVTMMMGMENPIHLADSKLREVIENFSGSKIDQDGMAAISNHVHVAGVFQPVEIFR